MGVLPVYICRVFCSALKRPGEGVQSPGTGVITISETMWIQEMEPRSSGKQAATCMKLNVHNGEVCSFVL